jgi:hypothetical protein
VDAARGSHTRWQESHMSVVSVRGAIVANLVSSGTVKLKNNKRSIIISLSGLSGCNLNVEDLKISTLLASTREHPLVFGGVTCRCSRAPS